MRADFTKKLLEWNERTNNRDMPWKGEKDPYKIWLSEIILQQTRVEQGTGYYNKFLAAYPNIEALAAAPDADVFKLWEGLGYYSRCRNLVATARIIVSQHGGQFPSTYNDILSLKGIGPYTAAAIASFAFNEKQAVVDGNVQRVLARYFGISTPVDSTAGRKTFASLAQSLIDERAPARYNQAIMDFGATVCKPRLPLCDQCIHANACEAYRSNRVASLPVKEKKLIVRKRWFYYFIMRFGDKIYIRKRNEKDIWQDLYEFCLFETSAEDANPQAAFLPKFLPNHQYSLVHTSAPATQQLTHQHLSGKFFVIHLHQKPALPPGYIQVHKNNLHEYAFPKFINGFLTEYRF